MPSVGRNEQKCTHRKRQLALNPTGHFRRGRHAPQTHPKTASAGKGAQYGGAVCFVAQEPIICPNWNSLTVHNAGSKVLCPHHGSVFRHRKARSTDLCQTSKP